MTLYSFSYHYQTNAPRGPGFWKFNSTLLNDEQYVNRARDTYSQALNHYSHLTDKSLFWEMIKIEIRSATISCFKSRSKRIRNLAQDILWKLGLLDSTTFNNLSSPDIDDTLAEYENLKTELKSIYQEKDKQAMHRAKCHWVENGERPTKYFFNLEK